MTVLFRRRLIEVIDDHNDLDCPTCFYGVGSGIQKVWFHLDPCEYCWLEYGEVYCLGRSKHPRFRNAKPLRKWRSKSKH